MYLRLISAIILSVVAIVGLFQLDYSIPSSLTNMVPNPLLNETLIVTPGPRSGMHGTYPVLSLFFFFLCTYYISHGRFRHKSVLILSLMNVLFTGAMYFYITIAIDDHYIASYGYYLHAIASLALLALSIAHYRAHNGMKKERKPSAELLDDQL